MRFRTAAAVAAVAAAAATALVSTDASAHTVAPARLTAYQAAMQLSGGHVLGKVVRPNATGYLVHIPSLYTGKTGQCLDADANNGASGTKVQAWTCNSSNQQEWVYWDDNLSLQNVLFPSQCLDADIYGGGKDGTRVQLWKCNNTTQQSWFMRSGDLAIYNVRFLNNYNTVLDRNATWTGDGAPVQLWTKNYQSQQWWKMVRP